ncbi:MAG: ribosome recycling factor [Thermaerobacterales bacterium]
MTDDILKDTEVRMRAAVEAFQRELATVRAGRASAALLDKVRVEYHGAQLPVNQVATIAVPEPRMLLIQPWDQSALAEIERALMRADLGMTPSSDGKVIRLNLPQLTEERRHDLVRQVRKMAEEARVAVRNVRRDGNDAVREAEREGLASEDEARRAMDEVQKTTDRFVQEIEKVVSAKEKEILEV